MPIVTIRGHLGSGAPETGKLIADKIHTDYIDREIIAEVAERLKWSKQGILQKEMPPGTLGGRILEALSHSYPAGIGYSGAYAPAWEIPPDDITYLAGLESVIKELAGSGSTVIRGRGSQLILRDYPSAFHVLIVAQLEIRLKRVMKSLKMDEEQAKKEIERFDSSRREFTKRYFHAELEDPLHYDLVVNTNHLDFEDAASIVVNAIPFRERQP